MDRVFSCTCVRKSYTKDNNKTKQNTEKQELNPKKDEIAKDTCYCARIYSDTTSIQPYLQVPLNG